MALPERRRWLGGAMSAAPARSLGVGARCARPAGTAARLGTQRASRRSLLRSAALAAKFPVFDPNTADVALAAGGSGPWGRGLRGCGA